MTRTTQQFVITHADDSHHDKTKTAETTIAKLATGKVHHEYSPNINIRSKGQRSRSQTAKTH